jgi:protocatechuate 3,4-dioxygenase beta subunit
MNRKDFLKGMGLAGLGLALPGSRSIAKANRRQADSGECVLIPSETAGPFPLDLTDNSFYLRKDVREDEEGIPLNLRMKIIGEENCAPMQNARVHIWHCDRHGVYSGYNTNGNPGDDDATHLRGYQMTDAHGEVEFITAFPGWYPGRITHIHFQVYVSSSYSAVSQLTFPLAPKNDIYADNPSLYPKGEDPLSFSEDFAFADGYDHQLATLEKNANDNSYNSYLEVTVRGSGTTSVGHAEYETAKVFELAQNYPNPYTEKTTIPIQLKQSAEVRLELWDLNGRKVATLWNGQRGVGHYQVEIHPRKLGLPHGNYLYQVVAKTGNRIYRLPKMMTVND